MTTWIPGIEQGLLYSVMALGVYLSFRILNFADLTVDGSFPLGAAVGASLIVSGHSPGVALLIATAAGGVAGMVTGLLTTRFKITPLLAGILTMTMLYSINLRIMGRPNIPLLGKPTLFRFVQELGVSRQYSGLVVFVVLVFGVVLALAWLLRTELGTAVRATGNNPRMMEALAVNTKALQILGLGLSNALVALCGALASQYQGFADVNLGVGMVISGLASVILGEVFLKGGVLKPLVAVVLGSQLYRLAVYFALRFGFPATDLKLVTALLVIIALVLPQLSIGRRREGNKKSSLLAMITRKAGDPGHA